MPTFLIFYTSNWYPRGKVCTDRKIRVCRSLSNGW